METKKACSFEVLPRSELFRIQPLWEQLRVHHQVKSPNFQKRYSKLSFEDRIQALLEKDELYIDIAKSSPEEQLVGYCVSSVNKIGEKTEGEIESILVAAEYRRFGIGDTLMRRTLEWLKGKNTDTIKIVVAAGNEEAFPFYNKYGFFHFSNILMLRN
jgi:diamine N-acetyltransferase